MKPPCLLGRKLTPDPKWNSYIRAIANDAEKMSGSSYRSSKYLIPAARLFCKNQFRSTIGYCCRIWKGADQSNLPKATLSHRRNVARLSLLYSYYYGKYWNELYSFPTVKDLLQLGPTMSSTLCQIILIPFVFH